MTVFENVIVEGYLVTPIFEVLDLSADFGTPNGVLEDFESYVSGWKESEGVTREHAFGDVEERSLVSGETIKADLHENISEGRDFVFSRNFGTVRCIAFAIQKLIGNMLEVAIINRLPRHKKSILFLLHRSPYMYWQKGTQFLCF